MSLELPEPIASYFAGQNDHDIDVMRALFAAAAIVRDEGQESGKTAVTGRVSGTFPGSPVELRYAFTFACDKISPLEILS